MRRWEKSHHLERPCAQGAGQGARVVLYSWRGRWAQLGGSEIRLAGDRRNTMWPHTVLLSSTQIPGPHTHFNSQPTPQGAVSSLLPPNNPSRLHPCTTPPFPAGTFPQLCRPLPVFSVSSVTDPLLPEAHDLVQDNLSLQFGAETACKPQSPLFLWRATRGRDVKKELGMPCSCCHSSGQEH